MLGHDSGAENMSHAPKSLGRRGLSSEKTYIVVEVSFVERIGEVAMEKAIKEHYLAFWWQK